jgi:AmpD protein
MTVDATTGLILGVRQVLSPNWDDRPAGQQPELIVVHGISLPPAEYGGPWIDRMFCGNLPSGVHPYFEPLLDRKLSAHALIRRDGTVIQYVPFGCRAWHAGVSEYGGRAACNDFSVGIELEGVDDAPYEPAQYAALGTLIAALLRAYPTLSADHLVGHSDIAPGRKTDPGLSFDWPRLRADLARRLAAAREQEQ